MKRAFALLVVVTCEQREAVETRGRVACHLVQRPGKKDGNVSLDCSPCRHVDQKKMETRVRATRQVDMRQRRERWKRVCGLVAASTKGPGKKDGNACAECLSRRQGAKKKKIWKCAFALFAVLPCEQSQAVETRGRVVYHMVNRPSKKDGNVSLDCSQCRQANQEKRMDTRV